jgi:hypothetical protein
MGRIVLRKVQFYRTTIPHPEYLAGMFYATHQLSHESVW